MTETPWTHRIDALPEIGREIEFHCLDGRAIRATVAAPVAADHYRPGVGDDVRYVIAATGNAEIPSLVSSGWRYVESEKARVAPLFVFAFRPLRHELRMTEAIAHLRNAADSLSDGFPAGYMRSGPMGPQIGAWGFDHEATQFSAASALVAPALPLEALAWMAKAAADRFADNRDGADPLAERDELRDLLAVMGWLHGWGRYADAAAIDGAMPPEPERARMLAYEPPAPEAPPSPRYPFEVEAGTRPLASFHDFANAMAYARNVSLGGPAMVEIIAPDGIVGQFVKGVPTPEFAHLDAGAQG